MFSVRAIGMVWLWLWLWLRGMGMSYCYGLGLCEWFRCMGMAMGQGSGLGLWLWLCVGLYVQGYMSRVRGMCSVRVMVSVYGIGLWCRAVA